MKMPFGKYKGRDIRDIPLGYLEWLLENVDNLTANQRREIEIFLGHYEDEPTRDPDPTPEVDVGRLINLVNRWRAKAAMKFHPDRGGDEELMKSINELADDLIRSIEGD